MPFASLEFLLFFLPAIILLYWLCAFSRMLQNCCLLAASLFFYAWGEPRNLLFLLLSVLINYGAGLLFLRPRSRDFKRAVLVLAVTLNVGLLLLGRYGVLMQGAPGDASAQRLLPELTVPALGISFFTLQALSYLFDVSRGKPRADKNIINVGLFISLFPTVLAGPVLRYRTFAGQLLERKDSPEIFFYGCSRFVIGLAKQVLIATSLGLMADNVFTMSALGAGYALVPSTLAMLGLLAFGLYIYFFFSGFSDMAIGLAAMLGFVVPENFNYPYISRSITEFWQRWHISLFRWFHTYIFVPMGGSRPRLARFRGEIRPRSFLVRNLFAMWLLLGLWHGLSWVYGFFGIWFFAVYLMEWIVKIQERAIPRIAGHIYFLIVLGIAWIFYRCDTFDDGMTFLGNLLGLNGNGFFSGFALVLLRENWLPLILGLVFAMPLGRRIDAFLAGPEGDPVRTIVGFGYAFVLIAAFCLCIVFISRGSLPPTVFM